MLRLRLLPSSLVSMTLPGPFLRSSRAPSLSRSLSLFSISLSLLSLSLSSLSLSYLSLSSLSLLSLSFYAGYLPLSLARSRALSLSRSLAFSLARALSLSISLSGHGRGFTGESFSSQGLGFRVTGSQVNVSVCLRVCVCVKTLNP